jgi:hypothetical protein
MAEPKASKEDAAEFLHQFKTAMSLGHYCVRDRRRNLQDLIDLGITGNQAKEVINNLTPSNYSAGPKPDDNEDGQEIWEFGAEIGDVEVYIKLQVKQDPKRRTVMWAIRYAFHKADFPMKYPYRGGGS